MTRLTTREYWDSGYFNRDVITPVEVDGPKNYMAAQQLQILESVDFRDKNVLEIGGAGSQWIVYLAKKYPTARFSVLDYSESGCELIKKYAHSNELKNLEAICEDFFETPSKPQFYDIVYSSGVVEHFTDLSATLNAFRKYVKPGGILITFIPNMRGMPGLLTRSLNRKVFDLHVAHDRKSLTQGHLDASFAILKSGYLGSSDFRVVSSCFEKQSGLLWSLYIMVTRISSLIWLFEYHFFRLPTTRLFSPFIYTVSQKPLE